MRGPYRGLLPHTQSGGKTLFRWTLHVDYDVIGTWAFSLAVSSVTFHYLLLHLISCNSNTSAYNDPQPTPLQEDIYLSHPLSICKFGETNYTVKRKKH